MLTIPLRLDVDLGKAQDKLEAFADGAKDALNEIMAFDQNKAVIEYEFKTNGERVRRTFIGLAAANKKLSEQRKKELGGVKGSIGYLKKQIDQYKKQREEVSVNSQRFRELSLALSRAGKELRTLQGVQEGSTAQLKVQRAELVQLRNNVKRSSTQYQALTDQINKLDVQLGKTNPKVEKQFKLFSLAGRIAVAGAAFNSVTAALRSVGNAAGVYVQRQKEIEAFDLALRNVGMTQSEVSVTFNKAADIARRLGAPLQQVEGLYKRMVPALQAVGASSSETDRFIEGISARTQTLGLNTEQSGRYLEAFAQVLSKGKLQSEELNQQISELDGSFRVQLADAIGVTTEELNQMIKDSEVTADVFVDAVNKMANGTEELIKRVKEGRATIQQLQNLIKIVDTKNIENIGKSIEPAIKSFLNIRLSFANFVAEFQKTKVFEALTRIVNGTVKGLENFVYTFLKLAQVLTTVLTPIASIVNVFAFLNDLFGGAVPFALAYIAVFTGIGKVFSSVREQAKKATFTLDTFGESFKKQKAEINKNTNLLKRYRGNLALMAGELGKTVIGLTGLRKAFFRKTGTVKVAGKEVQKYTFSLKKAQISLKRFGKSLGGIAGGLTEIINPLTGLIALFTATVDGVIKVAGAYRKGASAFDEYFRVISEVDKASKNVIETNKEVAASTEEEAQKIINANKLSGASWIAATAGVVAAGLAITAAIVATGGAATPVLLALGATGAAASVGINKAFDAFSRVRDLGGFTDRMKDAAKASSEFRKKIKGVNDFQEMSQKTLEDQIKQTEKQIRGERERVAAIEDRIQALKEEGPQNDKLIEGLKKEAKLIQAEIKGYKSLNQAQKDELATRIAFRKESDLTTASVETLNAALKKQEDSIKDAGLEGRIAAVKKFGQSQEDAGRLAAANLGIQIAENEQLIAASSRYVRELERRQATGKALSADEQKELRRLTGVVRSETLKRIELEQQAKAAIVDAFEAGIRKAQELGDVYGNISGNLRSAFDGVTSSLTGGLQSAVGLIDAVVQTEIRGLEVGSAKRKRIIREQLKGQALANDIENNIAQTKLRVQKTTQVSEARIAKLRLEAEAAIARSRGQTGVAKALSEAAGLQNLIIRSKEKEFELNSKALELQKLRKDELLIMKGLEEEIGSNANTTAKKIGVQKTSLKKANEEYKKLADESKTFSDQLTSAAEKMQQTKEEANKTSLRNGVEESEKVANALEASKDFVADLGDNFDVAIKSMATAEASAKRMRSYLSESAQEARKLASIVASGNPRRAMGGPVTSGQTYRVNDGGGREAFISNAGKFSMLPAARNINWTAPTSGTVIPASLVDQYKNALAGQNVKVASTSVQPNNSRVNSLSANLDSGNLVQRMAAVMSASGGEQRITNHVTIQSQEPVTDASKIMTNVARMKLRRGGNF